MAPASSAEVEAASFRDPDSRVFYADGAVYRALTERGAEQWERVAATEAYARLLHEGKVVGTERVDESVPNGVLEGAAAVLRHDRIPFVSYPYEWTFGMLKDAALLQLEVLREGLRDDVVPKDATPYNIQWRGTRPQFVDVGSFEVLEPGEPWIGYRQFCMLFLYPLLLQAYKGIAFQPWLRGGIDGIPPEQCRSVMSFRDFFRGGVFTHVYLHSRLERRHAGTDRDVRAEMRRAGFKKELIAANVRRLEKLIRRLEPSTSTSAWTAYGATDSYTEGDAAGKEDFVRAAVAARRRRLVWDLGANDGRFARIAATNADYVLAVDADAAVADALYASLKAESAETILPLTMNLVDPSPALGWRGRERAPLADRGKPDLTLCLALVHHVAISGNVPPRSFLEWLRSLGTALVIEFPTPDDPQVERLVAAKRERTHPDYNRPTFERTLAELFDVEAALELAGGRRVLYRAQPKG
jgi:SAM-dependent methyltransferase